MTPDSLQSWRKRMGWTAKEAAAQLGLSQNGYAAYERGWVYNGHAGRGDGRLGKDDKFWGQCPRPIPRHVELACERLEQLFVREQPLGL